jgi:hypothetical protein
VPQQFRLVSFVLVTFVVGLHAQDSSQWKDSSAHRTRFESVDRTLSWRCSIGVVPGGR